LLGDVNCIGRHLHDARSGRRNAPMSHDEMRTRYLVLEGQLDAVLQGLRSDYAEASAANGTLTSTIGPPVARMLAAIETYRRVAGAAVDAGSDAGTLAALDAEQQQVVMSVSDAWSATGNQLDRLLHERVHGLFARMWLHLGTALFLLCAILSMVYLVAQQISHPLRQLARSE
jgi:hypothetical protein